MRDFQIVCRINERFREEWCQFVSALKEEFGNSHFTVHQILEDEELANMLPDYQFGLSLRGVSPVRAIGKQFSSLAGQKAPGTNLVLQRAGYTSNNIVAWRVDDAPE